MRSFRDFIISIFSTLGMIAVLVISVVVWSFIIGSSGTVATTLTFGWILEEQGIEFGSRLADGGGPIWSAIIISIAVLLLGRLSRQASYACLVYFISGTELFILALIHPENVKLWLILHVVLAVIIGAILVLFATPKITIFGTPISEMMLTRTKPILGTILGFIPVMAITALIAMNTFLIYAEQTGQLEEQTSMAEIYIVSAFARNCITGSIFIGLACALISVGFGFILKKNVDEFELR